MVIGDAPTAMNAAKDEWMSGKPGAILKSELAAVGITEFYYTGVVKCAPTDKKKVEPAECKACSVYLAQEIREQNPKYILVLGATAAKAVTKAAKLSEVAGKVIDKDGIKYVPCFSPAFVLRDPGKEAEFKSTLRRFRDLTTGKIATDVKLRIRKIDRSNLDEFMQQFSAESEFTCDLETSGLDHYNPDSFINCVGVYLPKADTAWVLPIRKAPTLPHEAQHKLLHWMMDQKIPVINQNWKFDSLWLWQKFGVEFYNKFDTMLAHYCLDENAPHGLKQNARLYLGAPDYDLTSSEKKGSTDADKLFTYCAWDCYYTYELKKLFQRDLMGDRETRNIFEHLMMPASRMYEVIEREGHFVNLARRAEVRTELSAKLDQTEKQLNQMVGYPVNWNSPAQVGKALYQDLGLTPKVFTDKGAPSSGEAALAELDNHPVVKLLTEYRSYQKMLSTYVDGWDPFMVGPYLYLGTKLHGTVTGRFSSRLHQVPRDGTIRNLIEAPEGWTFIQGDLSQAELRVIAIVSQDPELIRCYNENIDVHWKTTIGILRMGGSEHDLTMARETVAKHNGERPEGITQVLDILEAMGPDRAVELDKRWKEKRKQSKGVNFGYVYGMGAKKFCEYAKLKYEWDVSLEDSSNIRDSFFGTYSALTPWHERQKAMVRIDGFVRSLSGRKRRLPGVWSSDRMLSSESERQSINAPVQGFIGDMKVMGMLEIYETLQKPDNGAKLRIKGEVHDSILMWVKTEYLDEMLPNIKKCMEHPRWIDQFGIKLPVPIVADIEVGTWGAGKTWKGQKYNA